VKIQALTLSNFRGFPYEETIKLDGKNLLVYGENGAGKSSIYHALKNLFTVHTSPKRSAKILRDYSNIFLNTRDQKVSIQIEGIPRSIDWTQISHPTQRYSSVFTDEGYSEVVTEAAAVSSFLDYRTLLDTNYTQTGEPNLFEIAISGLIPDFNVTVGGRWTTISKLWMNVRRTQPEKVARDPEAREKEGLEAVNAACELFNDKFAEALEALREKATYLLEKLGQKGMAIQSFRFANLKYEPNIYKSERGIKGRELTVNLSFYGQRIEKSQYFLNEARLSALAIAIYLAGRLTCLPTHDSYRNDKAPPLKLMVLDDLLVGMDQSNRLPLLQILGEDFNDWQIVLLTHDRVWFEMARFDIKETGDWNCLEILEGEARLVDADDEPAINDFGEQIWIPAPNIHLDHYSNLYLPQSLLTHAARFLRRGYLPASANYIRAAYEATLKTVCHEFGIPVPFNVDGRKVSSDVFHQAVVAWLETKPKERKEHLIDAMSRVALYRKIVLNPMSHSLPWKLTKGELEGAMRAVEALHNLRRAVEDVNPERLSEVALINSKAAPTSGELEVGLAKLRSAFHSRLSIFCRGKFEVSYSGEPLPLKQLWENLKATRPTEPEALRDVISDPAKLGAIEKWIIRKNPPVGELRSQDLGDLFDYLCQGSPPKLVFDK